MINGRKFRTVREIMEYYVPKDQPVSGEELARRLLRDFRKKLRKVRTTRELTLRQRSGPWRFNG